MRGPAAGRSRATCLGRSLLIVTAALAVTGTVVLAGALFTNDFSLTYVADHSRRGASGVYRLGGLWGGMAGSLLFWTALVATVSALGTRTSHRLGRAIDGPAEPVTNMVLAAVTGAFAATTVLLANPFATLATPAVDGGGLAPILEHPAMLYHPPLLYLGLVTLVVPFALTVAGLVGPTASSTRTKLDDAVKRWMLTSWTLLAVGMAAGANWAYVEVGWGGYWAWDPIENTALVPWLVTTAYLHARLRRPADATLNEAASSGAAPAPMWPLAPAALVLLAFTLASVGTLLTRSGAASSVHAFAQAVAVGRALLLIVGLLLTGSALALARGLSHARRDRGTLSAHGARRPFTRDTALGVQAVVVLAAVTLVLIGMLAPLVLEWATGDESLVEGSFYAVTIAPLAILVLVLTGLGPRLGPGPNSARDLATDLIVPIAAGLVTLALFGWFQWADPATLALAGAAGFAATSALQLAARARRARGRVSGHLAHLGIALLLLGVSGSTAATSRTVSVDAHETLSFDGVELRNDGAHAEPGPPPRVVAPVVITRRNASHTMVPTIDGYPDRGLVLAETALWSTPLEDIQVALRRADNDGNALFEVRVRPLAQLVWWGGTVLALSGLVALGEHARRRSRTPVAHPTEFWWTGRR